MFLSGITGSVSNSLFLRNAVAGYPGLAGGGGAVFVDIGSNISFVGVTFRENQAKNNVNQTGGSAVGFAQRTGNMLASFSNSSFFNNVGDSPYCICLGVHVQFHFSTASDSPDNSLLQQHGKRFVG